MRVLFAARTLLAARARLFRRTRLLDYSCLVRQRLLCSTARVLASLQARVLASLVVLTVRQIQATKPL